MAAGKLAIVLHTHMPYVEGFDTWPFGEEWLWEAIATSYLPVLDVLEETGAPVTVSLTPVLADQLEAPGAMDRCLAFLRELRPESHRIDLEEQPAELRPALERSAADYARAAEQLEGMDLLARFGRHAAWTSSATHAVLPLVATEAGAALQVQTGIDAHRRRFGDRWRGGFWLPECGHAPWLDPILEDAGAHAACVDLTDVFGWWSERHLTPLRTEAGVTLVPLDRQTIETVWSDDGYPADAAYRDYHHRTRMDHRPWAVDGSPYDQERALALAREHAVDFVARAVVRGNSGPPDPLVVCALDTELLGHWWYEGPQWLRFVVEECERQELELVHLDDALEQVEPAEAPALPTTTWGRPRDLSTWDGPGVEEFAWRARRAELDVLAAGGAVTPRAVRELLALQSSDWAFLVHRDLAAAYGHARAEGHLQKLAEELASLGSSAPELRNLAPFASAAPLLA
jgi:1,4-alpha-glucan branching enzyme